MVAVASVLRTNLLDAEEDNGTVVRLVTVSRVTGLTQPDIDVLDEALNTAGIPVAGSGLSAYPNLQLTKRSVKLIEGDPTLADVTLTYEEFKKKGQSFDAPINDTVVGQVRVDLQQVETNIDLTGNEITVQHTYPADDENFPGETKVQSGTVQTFQAQRTFTIQGIKNTGRPWLIANQIIGKLNTVAWSGEGPLEWMCVGASWDIHDRGVPTRYLMTFDFQHNEDTWDPTVIFKDDKTGKPPVGLVDGTGFKRVRIHQLANFENILGTRMQGA